MHARYVTDEGVRHADEVPIESTTTAAAPSGAGMFESFMAEFVDVALDHLRVKPYEHMAEREFVSVTHCERGSVLVGGVDSRRRTAGYRACSESIRTAVDNVVCAPSHLDALVKRDVPPERNRGRSLVGSLLASALGTSIINATYKDEFKPVHKADQYQASATSRKRKYGTVEHNFAFRTVLARLVKVFAIHHERCGTSAEDRPTFTKFICALRAERAAVRT